MAEKIRAAVVGYGNVGRFTAEAVLAAPDMHLTGIVRRSPIKTTIVVGETEVPVVDAVEKLGKVDVALLCSPTRSIPNVATAILSRGINTVDSFDIHGDSIVELRRQLDGIGKKAGAVAVISAGWDPGSDSLVRVLFEAMVPFGLTYTNFGPGMSMGHSTAVRSVPGVKDAISMTIPLGTGVHRRMVYIELEAGARLEEVETRIKQDPYFAKDETHVYAVEDVGALWDFGHGVTMNRKGTSGMTANQMLTLEMRINNPALTGQILVAAARAGLRQKPGAYVLPELPVLDMLPGDREELIRKLV